MLWLVYSITGSERRVLIEWAYSKISGNSELVRCIMKKLFFTVEADTEDKILDEIVALVAKVPKPTAGGSAVQTQAAQDNEEKAGAPGRVINESNTATVAKSTAKKKYPNFGTSKKKFNKQWLDGGSCFRDCVMGREEFQLGGLI